MATYPYTQEIMLTNNIKSTTVVSIENGMEVSVTTFSSSLGAMNSVPGSSLQASDPPVGALGSVTLSPVQSKAVDIKFVVGSLKINIELITFRAQFALDTGQVTCHGFVSDLQNNNRISFDKVIAAWS
ncbi:hypothetical protein ACHRV5_02500 [Flavobacterium sp. FlaQc-52]|jgi:hypothetical protein|uniref:hypothetical protein n=1 Tax=Flavobacterium sp. FlaQc-52 TaxID=3374185 RepID=UPI0037580C3F